MTWTLTLPYKRPPDGLSANWRGHWSTKARSTAAVRNLVVALVRSQQVPETQRIQVELVWIVSDRRRRDADNAWPLLKAVADGICADKGISAHITPDDTDAYCRKIAPRIEHQPGSEPRFEVRITDITHRPESVQQLVEDREL